jgi:hypothetical protein
VPIQLAVVRTALTTAPCIGVAWAVSHAAAGLPPLLVLALATAAVGISFLFFACLFGMFSGPETRRLRALARGGGERMRTLLARR